MIQENKERDSDQVRGKGPGGRKGSRRPTVNTQHQQNRGDDNQHSFHCQFLPHFFWLIGFPQMHLLRQTSEMLSIIPRGFRSSGPDAFPFAFGIEHNLCQEFSQLIGVSLGVTGASLGVTGASLGFNM